MTSGNTTHPDGGKKHIDGLLNQLSRKSEEYEARFAARAEPAVSEPFRNFETPGSQPSVEPSRNLGFSPSPQLRMDWLDVVAPLTFEIGERQCEVETASGAGRQPGAHGWTLVNGQISGEPFSIFAGTGFFETLANAWDRELVALPAGPQDAALVLEVVMLEVIRRIENRCSRTIDIVSVTRSAALPDLPWLSVVIRSGNEEASGGIAVGPNTGKIIEAFTAQNVHPGERNLDKTLLVKVGPIAMSTDQVYRTRPGVTVDCGINPSAEVRGLLERSDGSFWPVSIEDESIVIKGPLQKPLPANPAKDTTLVTLSIGTIRMPHFQRLLIRPDVRLPVKRFPENGAEFHVGNKALMNGKLDVIAGKLVVHISDSGAVR